MPQDEQPSGNGTLVIAALLVLALAFTSYWIRWAVSDEGGPAPVRVFGIAALAILALGILAYVLRGRRASKRR